jgi:hypothetical protein
MLHVARQPNIVRMRKVQIDDEFTLIQQYSFENNER